MSDEFLRKLYERTGEDYVIFDRYKVGRFLGVPDSQGDDIVNDLFNIELIKKIGPSKILLSKILLSFEEKQ